MASTAAAFRLRTIVPNLVVVQQPDDNLEAVRTRQVQHMILPSQAAELYHARATMPAEALWNFGT